MRWSSEFEIVGFYRSVLNNTKATICESNNMLMQNPRKHLKHVLIGIPSTVKAIKTIKCVLSVLLKERNL